MAKMLISQDMAISLENLMGMFFQMNRLLDRAKSQLAIKFVMPNTTKIVHIHWSHQMPLVGDIISDYCEDRNYGVNYPETTGDYSDYNNLTEMFNKIFEYMLSIETETKKNINLAIEEGDDNTEIFLKNFLNNEIRKWTKLAQNFVDYIEQNGDDSSRHMSMDARINKFLGINLEEDDD